MARAACRLLAVLSAMSAAGTEAGGASCPDTSRTGPEKLLRFSHALRGEGRAAESLACYKQLTVRHPQFAEGWFELGMAESEAGRESAAIAALARGLRLKPSPPPARLRQFGVALQSAGRLTEARAAYRRSIAASAGGEWVSFARCSSLDACNPTSGGGGPPPPPTPRGQCGPELPDTNLVFGDCATVAGLVGEADACRQLCAADPACNFWTWHDAKQGSYARKCCVRHDDVFSAHTQSGHTSGVCNHTLSSGAGGVHGLSVGARMIDLLPSTTAAKVRFRCTGSLAPDGKASIKSFSVHQGEAPPE
jgi:hypothetical protein